MPGRVPARVEERREFLTWFALVGIGFAGTLLVVLSAAFPWWRSAGTVLQPLCTDDNYGLALLPASLAAFAALAMVPRDRTASGAAVILSAASVGSVLVAIPLQPISFDGCGVPGQRGLAYGWLIAILGASLSAAAASLRLASELRRVGSQIPTRPL